MLAERLFVAVGLEAIAQAGRHAALPDDGVGDRFAARFFPEDRRLPLVGDADGRHVARPTACFLQRFAGHVGLRLPDRLGIVLDVARLREDLLEFFLSDGNGPAVFAEDDGPAGSRSLIESENAHGGVRLVGAIRELFCGINDE